MPVNAGATASATAPGLAVSSCARAARAASDTIAPTLPARLPAFVILRNTRTVLAFIVSPRYRRSTQNDKYDTIQKSEPQFVESVEAAGAAGLHRRS
jgi:hypothetical protein